MSTGRVMTNHESLVGVAEAGRVIEDPPDGLVVALTREDDHGQAPVGSGWEPPGARCLPAPARAMLPPDARSSVDPQTTFR